MYMCSWSLCAEEACLSIAGSKDTPAEMVYLQFQPSLVFMLCALVLLINIHNIVAVIFSDQSHRFVYIHVYVYSAELDICKQL